MEPTLIIKGDPESLELIVDTILGMAADADAEDKPEIADAIAAILPELRVMKAAQYEGFQNYWLANGRAFELSFKHKLEENDCEEESFHDAWFDTLQDYTESLMSDQSGFLGKNLKTAQYEGFSNHWLANSRAFELAFKHKLEQKEESEESFHDAWFDTLDEFGDDNVRNDFLKHLAKTAAKEDHFMTAVVRNAARRGITVAQAYKEWEDYHLDAMRSFLRKVAAKVEDGTSPGVAFYEIVNYYASGKHAKDTLVRIAKEVKPLSKGAGFLGDLWEGIKSAPDQAAAWVNRQLARPIDALLQRGDAMKALRDVEQAFSAGRVQANISKLDQDVASRRDLGIGVNNVNKAIGPFLEVVRKFYRAIGANEDTGQNQYASPLGPFPDPIKFVNPDRGTIGPNEWNRLKYTLGGLIQAIEGIAKEYDEFKEKGIAQPTGGMDAGAGELTASFEVYERQLIELFQEAGVTMDESANLPPNVAEIIGQLMEQHQVRPGTQVSTTMMTNLAWKAVQSLTKNLETAVGTAMRKLQAGGGDVKARGELMTYVRRTKTEYRNQFIDGVKSYMEGRLRAATPMMPQAGAPA